MADIDYMSSIQLPADQWTKIQQCLRDCPDVYVGKEFECRRFIESVLWMARSGAQWRLLPAEYGKWSSIYKRFVRRSQKGIWERMYSHSPCGVYDFIEDADFALPCANTAAKSRCFFIFSVWFNPHAAALLRQWLRYGERVHRFLLKPSRVGRERLTRIKRKGLNRPHRLKR